MRNTWFELDDKFIPANYLVLSLVDLAINRQLKVNSLLRGTGIFYQDLDQASLRLSSSQVLRLLENTQAKSNHEDFGFLVGRRLMSFIPAELSNLLINCRNLTQMHRVSKCYQPFIFPLLYLEVERCENKTYFLIENAITGKEIPAILMEIFCAAINATIKWRFNRQLPIHYYFASKRPTNIYQYEENLGHRLHFNCQQNMLVIDNKWLNFDLVDTSNLAKQMHFKQCRTLRKQTHRVSGIVQRIAQIIQQNNLNIRLDEVAELLALSPATLKRKLKSHYTSFQEIQDQVKKRRAVFQLTVNNVNNEAIARQLQFNDLNNFRRAFKRWTGMTPSQFRTQKRSA